MIAKYKLKLGSFFKSVGSMKKIIIKIILIIIFLGGLIIVIKLNPEILGLVKPVSESNNDNQSILTQVSKLIDLPSDEVPTIATVTEAEKVKDQLFFKNAQNEDKVLIYPKSNKIILFRPSEGKIIEIGTVNSSGEGDLKSQTYTFIILNSTQKSGLALKEEESLLKIYPNYSVIKLGNIIGDYPESVIVDTTNEKSNITKLLAEKINLKVGELSDSIKTTITDKADFIIIIGEDR